MSRFVAEKGLALWNSLSHHTTNLSFLEAGRKGVAGRDVTEILVALEVLLPVICPQLCKHLSRGANK